MEKKKQLLNKSKLIEKKRSAHTKDLIETLNEFTIKTQLALLEDAFTSYMGIREHCRVMEPLAQALNLLLGDKFMCMGYLLPSISGLPSWLKNKLSKLSTSGGSCKALATACLDGVNAWFGSMISKKSIVLAAVTHPKFKIKCMDPLTREEAKDLLLNEISLNW